MITVVIRNEYSDYYFDKGLYVRVSNAGDGKINVTLINNRGTRLVTKQEVCSIKNKRECKKIAIQFLKNNSSSYGMKPDTVKLDHEVRYFLVGAIDKAKRQVVHQDCWIQVGELKDGVHLSGLGMGDICNTKISSTKEVEKLVINLYKKITKI